MAKLLISNGTVKQLRRVMEAAMDSRCVISRLGSAVALGLGEDEYGHPIRPETVTSGDRPVHLDDLPCLFALQVLAGQGEQQSQSAQYVANRYTLAVPAGTDVLVSDRVEAVIDRFGQPVDPTVLYYEIKDRHAQPTHISLVLEAIR